jgi:RNA polymerase subunit RPABC4/transcription elongation factor Spt4
MGNGYLSNVNVKESLMPREVIESIGLILQVVVALAGAFLFAFWISLVIWTFNDIRSRTHDVLAWVLASLMVLIFGPVGLLIYFLLRPRETLHDMYERQLEQEALLQELEAQRACPNCGRPTEPDFRLCPYCRTPLKRACQDCGRLLHLEWSLCPYCGNEADGARARVTSKKPAEMALTQVE